MKPEQIHSARCNNCPHLCGAKREEGDFGVCHSGRALSISSIFVHHGEEPPVSGTRGICNIFFSHCNLQCIYCQNYQISRNDRDEKTISLGDALGTITASLDSGVPSVGFVSPSHMASQVMALIQAIKESGRNPIRVWNSNGYDRATTLREFDGLIDVYLPDFKYSDEGLGERLSGIRNYPGTAIKAIREMIRQRGTSAVFSEDGIMESGVIIRHLILPGHVENSKNCLRMIADELSTSVHISLMSQYHPVPGMAGHSELNRTITRQEYMEVLEEYYRLGFYRGWTQELVSESFYIPDFSAKHPFPAREQQPG